MGDAEALDQSPCFEMGLLYYYTNIIVIVAQLPTVFHPRLVAIQRCGTSRAHLPGPYNKTSADHCEAFRAICADSTMKFGTWELNLALEYLLHMDTTVCTTKSLWGKQVLEDPKFSLKQAEFSTQVEDEISRDGWGIKITFIQEKLPKWQTKPLSTTFKHNRQVCEQ